MIILWGLLCLSGLAILLLSKFLLSLTNLIMTDDCRLLSLFPFGNLYVSWICMPISPLILGKFSSHYFPLAIYFTYGSICFHVTLSIHPTLSFSPPTIYYLSIWGFFHIVYLFLQDLLDTSIWKKREQRKSSENGDFNQQRNSFNQNYAKSTSKTLLLLFLRLERKNEHI